MGERMNIKVLIKEAHEQAIKSGFYDCPECCGKGGWSIYEGKDIRSCNSCNGTGINLNRNIGELLMLIVSELGEALEAHRCGRLYSKFLNEHKGHIPDLDDWSSREFEWDTITCGVYDISVKDTLEDEMSDVYIRLFDLCGYLGIEPSIKIYNEQIEIDFYDKFNKNIGEALFDFTMELRQIRQDCRNPKEYLYIINDTLGYLFGRLSSLCKSLNIPIEKHIRAKSAYNRTRPKKHGRRY